MTTPESTMSKIPLVKAAGGVIGQVAVVVEDLRAALKMWGSSDSDHVWRIWTYSPEMIRIQTYLGEPSHYAMRVAMNGQFPQFEFVQPLIGPSIYDTWLAEGRTGVHHLGFYVDQLRPVINQMERAGFATVLTGEGYGLDDSGHFAYFDTRNVLGFYLEGIQVPVHRRPPELTWPSEEVSE